MPGKRKKNGGKKSKRRREEDAKRNLEILLSVHARTSQANSIWIRRPKCVQIYCKLFYGNFKLFIARHEVTRKPLDELQNVFFGKIPRGEWDYERFLTIGL